MPWDFVALGVDAVALAIGEFLVVGAEDDFFGLVTRFEIEGDFDDFEHGFLAWWVNLKFPLVWQNFACSQPLFVKKNKFFFKKNTWQNRAAGGPPMARQPA